MLPAPTMNPLRLFALLFLFFIGCTLAPDNVELGCSGDCVNNSWVSDDTTLAASYTTGRGALLGTRFKSFEALKSVIQIEYELGAISSDSTTPENRRVRVRHCSNGREVVSVLEAGTSQGDILKARYQGAILDRISLLFNCPFAVANRKDMERILYLSRWSPEWFGEGDPAFFDIAKSSVENINTPDLAIRNPRDTTEKGYLNSFNHITAQAFITSCFSEEMADFIADAHERFRHPELITGKFTETQIADLEEGPIDNYVDIINNEWGQELGKQLKARYGINRETNWTPELLANYLNDLQSYYSWAFQIGFDPYRPEDKEVQRFSNKMNALMKDRVKFNK
ncbi:MAG: hypothetical protein ACKVU0_20310 [Saprospiraceae bacterium]